ncbi:hypothetical protein JZ751_028283 [Albula glossodonta]|uniref:Fibrinogen C-terminal domain-containing protein n=1 Tax=Albula glossodonta TaxID=121402 RepID=A0A8T2MR26_9TELE|nr:hypothetical protein JZ751_028283 [Albula glossodonta]
MVMMVVMMMMVMMMVVMMMMVMMMMTMTMMKMMMMVMMTMIMMVMVTMMVMMMVVMMMMMMMMMVMMMVMVMVMMMMVVVVIQRRMDGTVNFYRPWDQYKKGFGNPDGEYWLGLENIFLLTSTKSCELKVDMEDFEEGSVHSRYSSFHIDRESEGYKLHVSGYIDGGAGDSLTQHNEMKFTTFDKDQDHHSSSNCATVYHGGFWFKKCYAANPNGLYTWGSTAAADTGVIWHTWKGVSYSLKSITMKIRPLPVHS